jgi:ATP-binding cassette subfamily B protein
VSKAILSKLLHTLKMPPKMGRLTSTNLFRALSLIWKSGPGWAVANSALVLLQGLLPPLTLYLMKLVIDAVTMPRMAAEHTEIFGQVLILIGLLGGVALASTVCNSLAALVGDAHAQRVTDHIHDRLHAKSIAIDLAYYENSQYYDTLHRAQHEAAFRPMGLLHSLLQIGQSSISLLALAGLLYLFHCFVRFKYAVKLYAWERQQTPAERQAWYLSWLLTRDVYAKEVRLLHLGPLFMDRFRRLRALLRREKLSISSKQCIAEVLAHSTTLGVVFGLYGFIAYRTAQGSMTVGDFVLYYQAMQRGQEFLRQILHGLAGLYEDNLFLSNLFEFLDLPCKVVQPVPSQPVPRPIRTGIVFDHVSFYYPTSTRMVLDDVTLTIRPGAHVAFVGENGAGKTSIIKLLCRLYDPTGGSIRVDGIDLRQLDTTALRREISVIFQDYAHYHLTARDNIWLGNVDFPPDQERIEAAARHAGADAVIARLPRGYETMLGNWFETGEELSIGEWQKIALARAFLRQAQIIVFDEPTSAMDAKAEYHLFQKLHQLTAGRTVILISHRLSTVKMADCIYVLEHGRIVESGTHDELHGYGGTYTRLFETQAQYYK